MNFAKKYLRRDLTSASTAVVTAKLTRTPYRTISIFTLRSPCQNKKVHTLLKSLGNSLHDEKYIKAIAIFMCISKLFEFV